MFEIFLGKVGEKNLKYKKKKNCRTRNVRKDDFFAGKCKIAK